MPDAPAALIAATSGRALAQSARRAGYRPLVVDRFADDDTREVCEGACMRLVGGFRRDALLRACERLAGAGAVAGIVYGPGFEDRPQLIGALAARWRLWGNAAGAVARLKDPEAFAALCARGGIAHPEIASACPADSALWLARQRGGSGGAHIRPASAARVAGARTYYQRRAPGRPVSALVLACAGGCAILGFSEQWAAPTRQAPFRFAGAAQPADLSGRDEKALCGAIERFCALEPLVGLNSFDFLVHGGSFCLLEVNPRPGATLDVFESGNSLFGAHVAACEGRLRPPKRQLGATAAATVYLDQPLERAPILDWPAWARDRSPPGVAFKAGEPFCTVFAPGVNAFDARRRLDERAAWIRAAVQARAA